MARDIPRYVIGTGPLSYEIGVAQRHDGRPFAVLSVSDYGWPEALQSALSWSDDRTEAEAIKTGKYVTLRPVVRYRTAGEDRKRVAGRIDGKYVWTETVNEGPSAWLPLDAVKA